MRKRRLALLLTLAMIISMFPINAFATEFSDMPEDWSTRALENAVANGLLKGDNGKIMPNDNLTRAQMATIVNRAFGTTEKSSIDNFTDVKNDVWYYSEMSKAVQMKTFIGSGDKLYPDSNITREEAFIVLARAFKISGENENTLDKFSDRNDISDWARDGVSSLVEEGYIAGSNGRINPKQNTTRAEFAQMMDNLLKNYISKEGTYTEDYSGNLMINVPNVTLKGLTITGDLIIGDGVGDGDVTLDDVTVTGRVLVRGGGENSIRITGNSNIQNITIARVDGIVRVYAEDGTEIGEVIADGNDDVIIEGNFGTVTIVGTDISVTATNATIESASIAGENSNIIIDENSSVKTINVNANNVKISGDGTVESVTANANNVTVTTPNTTVTAGEGTEGVTAGEETVVPGETVTVPSKPVETGGGGRPSGGPPHEDVAVSAISDITGDAVVGETLTAGTVTPSGATVTYQWISSATFDGIYTNISGATSITYTIVADDTGKYVKVKATGTGNYTGSITSAAKGPIVSVESVESLITALPEVPTEEAPEMPDLSKAKPDGEKLTAIYNYLEYLENAEAVAVAKEAFDALDPDNQGRVGAELNAKLDAAVDKMSELKEFVVENTTIGVGTYNEDYSGLTEGAKGRIMLSTVLPFYIADGFDTENGLTSIEEYLYNDVRGEIVRNVAVLEKMSPTTTSNWPCNISGSFDLGAQRISSSGSWESEFYQLVGDTVTQADLPNKVVVEFIYKGVLFVIEEEVSFTPDTFSADV